MKQVSMTRIYQLQTNNETSEYNQEIPVTDKPLKRVSMARKYQSQTNQWNEWYWPGNTSYSPTNETSEYAQEIPVTD